jgi:hypothetical protein
MADEKREFNYDDLFPERWLHAEDLLGRNVTLEIAAAYEEILRLPDGSNDRCGILSFKKTKREYVLNKTNAMVLRELWGKKSGDWVGHQITLAPVPDPSGKSRSGKKILFVGSPDIAQDTTVNQPQNKTRVIKKTQPSEDRVQDQIAAAPPEHDGVSESPEDAETLGGIESE